jgi:hypothetical protein
MCRSPFLTVLLLAFAVSSVARAAPPAKPTPKEALQGLNDLIGSWSGTGQPSQGTREEKQNGFWTETIAWEWQFKGEDVFLKAAFEKSKYFTGGELRYMPDKSAYRLTIRTVGKETLTFDGTLAEKKLILERPDEKKNETQRLTFNLLHDNWHLYRYEVKAEGRKDFKPVYQVGAKREGVSFAGGDGKPECVVSGGLGTIKVDYKGKTFYVCCTGCRDAFKDEPERYIKEYETRKAKGK